MNLLNFINQYPDEESCKLKLKAIRDKEGIVCRRCGSKDHYWKSDKWQYECKHCKSRTTLRSGTIMHGSQLPLRYWFVAMHLLTSTKKSFSALELQRQLGHKYYEPIWTMLHKLRFAMGKRDSQYSLSDQIELDEGFFSTEVNPEEKDNPRKRGRGSQKMTKVLVMAESKEVEGKTTKKGKPRKVGFIKMQVIPNLKAETINEQVRNNISKESTLITDDSTSYNWCNINGRMSFLPGTFMSKKSKKSVAEKFRELNIHKRRKPIEVIAKELRPVIQGIINYYCKFSSGHTRDIWLQLNVRLRKWVKMGERALQEGIVSMVAEKVQGITFTFSALAIGKSIKCLHFCD